MLHGLHRPIALGSDQLHNIIETAPCCLQSLMRHFGPTPMDLGDESLKMIAKPMREILFFRLGHPNKYDPRTIT